jgi:hypothetical protein
MSEEPKEGSVLAILVAQSQRWKAVTLEIGADGDAIASIKGNIPLLEFLDVHFTRSRMNSLFAIAPSLRNLRCPGRFGSYEFPWAQLKKLVVHRAKFRAGLCSLAGSCTSLAELVVIECAPHVSSDLEIVTSPLQTLTVIGHKSFQSHEYVFNFMTMPSLARIYLSPSVRSPSQIPTEPFPFQSFSDFLSRSSCTISVVHLEDTFLTESETVTLLELLPALADLTYVQVATRVRIDNPDGILTRMITRASRPSSVLLPKLTRLQLSLFHIPNQPMLADMIKSRWLPYATPESAIFCLRRIDITVLLGAFDKDTMAPLRDISKAGMNIVLKDLANGFLGW